MSTIPVANYKGLATYYYFIHSTLFNLIPTKYIMWPRVELTHHQPKAMFSSLSADKGKKQISVGREKETVKDERECQSAKINRWIKTTADVSLFTIPFYVFTFFFLYQVFLHLTLPESQKMLTNSRLGDSSIFICTWSKKKKKPVTSSSPTPPLKHFVSPTLWQSSAPWVTEPLLLPTPSWGTLYPGTSVPPMPLVYLNLIFKLSISN